MADTLNGKDIRALFGSIKNLILANRDRLTELDSAIGDGDLGITMSRGFEEADRALGAIEEADPGKLLMSAGMTIAKTAPSTMGTLVATGFMKGGKAVSGKDALSLGDIALFFEAFAQGIMDRGKAKPGEKTILDTLVPAAEALRRASSESEKLDIALSVAYDAALQGAENTKNMKARHGRPAYYGDASVGKEDPGAAVGVIILEGFVKYAVS